MGDPQRSYPVILVAGSSGSTTVTRLLGAILAASGLTVATLVSAELEQVGERVARNGEVIADAELAEALGAVADLEAAGDRRAELVRGAGRGRARLVRPGGGRRGRDRGGPAGGGTTPRPG